MALSAELLAADLKARMLAVPSAIDNEAMQAFCEAIAEAVVEHLIEYAVVDGSDVV